MQIMPVNTSGSTASRSTTGSSRDDMDFMKILSSALENNPAEISPVLDAVPSYSASADNSGADSSIPLDNPPYDDPANSSLSAADAPYSTAPSTLETRPETTPVEDIRFTDSELNDVIKDLREQGVDDEALARVAALMNRPNGTSVKEIHDALMNSQPAQLTDADMQRIASFIDRIDPTGQFKQSIMDDLKAGNTFKAFENLNAAMQKMVKENPSSTLNMDKGELLSLAKALRVNDETMKKLEKAFGKQNDMKLSAEAFREFASPIQLDIDKQAKDREKIIETMATALKPTVDKARKRLAAEADAAGVRNRRTEQTETLIRDSMTREGLNKTAETAASTADTAKSESTAKEAKATKETANAAEAKADKAEKSALQTESSSSSGQSTKQDTANSGQKNESNAATLDARAAAEAKAKSKADETAATKPEANTKSTKTEDPWDALIRKLDAQPVQTTTRTAETPQPMAASASITTQTAGQAAAQAARTAGTTAARVLSQVEQGVFSALADGTKRLTLNLNPVELGAVSVMLSSRNGEVSAVLRPERPETAAMLNQQIDTLKMQLEQQGIKVDKVDVQTPQNQNNSHQQWQGMEQHNTSQEQQARQEALDRMRRIGKMRESEPATFNAATRTMNHRPTSSHTGGVNIIL